ncbi:hypothetical protein [Jeotgalibacillus sp. R-1-5s-1]|uniref:hypothetical protein n=1 Tax=Jeotgalibacillus sp. R-1-5s-1 TaxID=2555897 RepID=UPI00106A4576|nr:hypothetical protein [Jeotgalibacillus sp. R-1-5s-1]TFE00144.1 hypothetical protein E2491_06810 [Jeotgalibacillus sp. R-1-5s-1]
MLPILLFHSLLTLVIMHHCLVYRDRTGYHLAMNVAMLTGASTGIIMGIGLMALFPFHFVLVTILSACLGACAGLINGWFYDQQTGFSGLSSGFMAGLMGPMLGASTGYDILFVWGIEMLYLMLLVVAILMIPRS